MNGRQPTHSWVIMTMRHAFLMFCLAFLGCGQTDAPKTKATASRQAETPASEPVSVKKTVTPSVPVAAVPQDEPARTITVQDPAESKKKEEPIEEAPPIPETFKPLNKANNLFFEKNGDARRVHLLAQVCLREGPLEVLLCKMNTKEHESIMHVDADAREIHFALIAAGAQPGTPVKFVPKYQGATGTKIKVTLAYREKGKVKTVTAQDWIMDKKTGKSMAHEWVFAGSKFFQDPERPNAIPYYMANNGEIISLANFPDSMMDLPVKSPKEAQELIYEINTPKIPPLRTPVLITFEPVLEKK